MHIQSHPTAYFGLLYITTNRVRGLHAVSATEIALNLLDRVEIFNNDDIASDHKIFLPYVNLISHFLLMSTTTPLSFFSSSPFLFYQTI